MRDRALFDLAVDSKLRGCDLGKIKIGTLVAGAAIRTRSMVIQQKTGRPVEFEITRDTRASLLASPTYIPVVSGEAPHIRRSDALRGTLEMVLNAGTEQPGKPHSVSYL